MLLELIKELTIPSDGSAVKADVSKEDYKRFNGLLLTNDAIHSSFKRTNSAAEFFKCTEIFEKAFDKSLWSDLFYASKSGFWFNGVSPRVTYYFKKILSTYTPNMAISKIDPLMAKTILIPNSLPTGVCFKDVMNNILGVDFEEIKSYKFGVKWKNCYEVYLPKLDRVAVLNEDFKSIAESNEFLANVYLEKEGLAADEHTLLRLMFGYMGITDNDFDLRELK